MNPAPIRDVAPPKFVPPPGSCDCHVHIVGPQEIYPLSQRATIDFPDSTLEDFRKVQDALGMSRAIIVGFGHYHYDYQHVLHAVAGDPERYRGIIIVPPDITDGEMEMLNGRGVVGARFYPGPNVPAPSLLDRIDQIGWSASFAFANTAQLEAWAPVVDGFRGRMILDHCGLPPVDQGLDSPHFKKVLGYLDTGRCWIKLSHRFSKMDFAPFEDTLPFLHELVRRRPDRMLYGSDYPHPSYWEHMPNEATLLDLMLDWTSSEDERKMILVDNPAELFGFPPLR